MNVTLNQEQRLFVLPSGSGYSCLGFDVVFKRLKQYAQLLGLAQPSSDGIGTLAQYRQYLEAERAYIAAGRVETLFDPDTPAEVQRILELKRGTQQPIRVHLGDAKTGRSWLEEHDVIGTVGRSMGPVRVPLLCKAGSGGGFAMLTACVLRIQDAKTGHDLYRHPSFHLPELRIVPSTLAGYVEEVHGTVPGTDKPSVHARFKSAGGAQKWIAFMNGERMRAY